MRLFRIKIPAAVTAKRIHFIAHNANTGVHGVIICTLMIEPLGWEMAVHTLAVLLVMIETITGDHTGAVPPLHDVMDEAA